MRLFDLAHDVSERNDRAAAEPAVAQRLRAKYDAWAKTLRDPLWPCKQEGKGYKEADWSEAAADAD